MKGMDMRRSRHRARSIYGALLVAALILSACGGTDDVVDSDDTSSDDEAEESDDEAEEPADDDAAADGDQDPVTIEVWFNGAPDSHGVEFEELVAEYEDANPNVTVEWELLAWDVYLERIASAAAGGTLPDLIFTYTTVLPSLASQGILADHSEYLDPSDYEDVGVELTTWDGVWSAVPYWMASRALFYRADLAEEAGLDPDSPPQDWDELRNWAEAMTIEEDGQFEQLGYTVRQGIFFAIPDQFLTMLWSNGGELFDEEGLESTVDSPEGVEALTLMQDLFECCDQPGAIEAENLGLGQGQVAMLLSNHAVRGWTSDFPELAEQQAAGITIFPAGPSSDADHGQVTVGADIMALTAQADEPEQAAHFLEFLTADPDNSVQLAALAADIPGSAHAEGHSYFDEDPFVERRRQVLLDYGRTPPKHPGYSAMQNTMTSWLDELTVGGSDPQSVAEGMAEELTQIVAESGVPVEDPERG